MCIRDRSWAASTSSARRSPLSRTGARGPQSEGTVVFVGDLVELRRWQGRLAEAEQELGTLVADMRRLCGPQHPATLEAEAVAAGLRHAQPDGAAVGAAELRAVVERMTEFLGAAHQDTRKWQRVLEEMPVEFVLEQ